MPNSTVVNEQVKGTKQRVPNSGDPKGDDFVWGDYHKVFLGREVAGDITTPEMNAYQCHTCWRVYTTEEEMQAHECH